MSVDVAKLLPHRKYGRSPSGATGMLPQAFQSFIDRSPICVMARAVLENLFRPERLDDLFERTSQNQYRRKLLFSSVVDLMQGVVLGFDPSVFAAYTKRQKTFPVSDQALYDKLNGMELAVSATLVRDSARPSDGRSPPRLVGKPHHTQGAMTRRSRETR